MEKSMTQAFEMIDTFLEIIQIENPDELEKQLIAAYIFGMLNGMAQSGTLSPEDVQAIMIRIGMEKLSYSPEAATQMIQFVINATDRDFHPTVNAIIHRGIESYFIYTEGNLELVKSDFLEIVGAVKS